MYCMRACCVLCREATTFASFIVHNGVRVLYVRAFVHVVCCVRQGRAGERALRTGQAYSHHFTQLRIEVSACVCLKVHICICNARVRCVPVCVCVCVCETAYDFVLILIHLFHLSD